MDFGGFLAERIERARLTRIAFAKAIGSSSGFMTDVIKGRRTPPLDRLDAWADVLGLDGQERTLFLDLAALAHLPDEVRPRFLTIYQEHRELMAFKNRLESIENAREK